jgi:methyltransferase (TIGR00027 family)
VQTGQPSHTAIGAAAYRAIHQQLEGGAIFRDPFAASILDDETSARLNDIAADPALRPMRLFIAARSRFSEDTLAACVARGVRQIVVLGAGLDTFSLRNPFAANDVRVFEVDYAATEDWKRPAFFQWLGVAPVPDARGGRGDAGFHRASAGVGSRVRLRRAVRKLSCRTP